MRYLLTAETTQAVAGEDPRRVYWQQYSLPYHHPARARHAKTFRSPGFVADGENRPKIEHGESGVFRFIKHWTTYEGEPVIERYVVTLEALPPGNPLRGMKPVRGRNV